MGLGSGAGRIEWDDQSTDEVNILNARLGIGTATPGYLLHSFGGNVMFATNGAEMNAFIDSDGASHASTLSLSEGGLIKWQVKKQNNNQNFIINRNNSGYVAQLTLNWANNTATVPGTFVSVGLTNSGKDIRTPTAKSITAASDTIPITGPVVKITLDANYTLTSQPTIANGTDGQVLIIVNVDGADTLTLNDGVDYNLRLNASTVALGPRDALTLLYSSDLTDWIQLTPVSNN